MSRGSVRTARRYAKALSESYNISDLESVRDELTILAQVWRQDRSLRDFILNPAISLDARHSVLREMGTAARKNDQYLSNLLSLLLANGRIQLLPLIADSFAEIVAALRKLLQIEIISAFPIPGAEQQDIVSKIKNDIGTVPEVKWSIDPNILGGLLIKSGDRLIDRSIKGSLNKFKEDLLVR